MEVASKYQTLLKNTAIFAIGTFGSKVLTFLIVPLYTHVLCADDYGKIDLFSTSVSLMIPFTTLVVYEAVIRFLTVKEIDESQAVSNSMLVFGFGAIVTLLGTPLYRILFHDSVYAILYILCVVSYSYNQIFSHYLRASGKNIAFSINGILITLVTVVNNLVLLLLFRWGAIGYLLSILIAQIIACIQVTIAGDIFKLFSIKRVKLQTLKKMFLYCIPLIPNNLLWWIMNAGDKYIINYFLGSKANGIYALSMKIPTILNLLYSIFMQAWQLSAIEEDKNEGHDEFYNKVFNFVSFLLIITSYMIIAMVKPLFVCVMGEEYIDAWRYVPFLCIAMIISCFSVFAGVNYMVTKKSNRSFMTTFLGAVGNLFFNLIFIQFIGLHGVAIGTILGYLIVFVVRVHDAKKDLRINLDCKKVAIGLFLLTTQTLVLLLEVSFSYALQIVIFCAIIFWYRDEFKIFVKKLYSYANRLKNKK